MKLFDSHCHLTAEAFAGELDAVLARAREAGVEEMVTIASDPDDAAAGLALARALPGVACTAGLHPHDAERFGPETEEAIRRLLSEPEVVAVGETGLDFFYDNAPRARQRAGFEAQLRLAREAGLPVVVHAREADAEVIEVLRSADGVRGVLHCFTGGAKLLDAGLDAGWHISFSGIVTFRRFDAADLVRRVPEDRLLIESDSPYLAPVPHRGKRNEPAHLGHTCEAVAAIRGVPAEALAETTRRNARHFYGLD
ncbi:MAG: TatD family hydrolase [Gemmatimonadota bacterium]